MNDEHMLALTSRRALLQVIDDQATHADNFALRADLRQLQGLCARMDSQAFLPLTPQDTASAIGIRVQQYVGLIDDVVHELVHHHGASTKGLKAGGGPAAYARFFTLRGRGLDLSFSPLRWARYGEPLCLDIKTIEGTTWVFAADVRDAVCQHMTAEPGRVISLNGATTVSVALPLGVESEDVLDSTTHFISDLAARVGVDSSA